MTNIEIHLFGKSKNEQVGIIRIDSDVIPRTGDLLTIEDNKVDSGLNNRVFEVFQVELNINLTCKHNIDGYIKYDGSINPKNKIIYISANERY